MGKLFKAEVHHIWLSSMRILRLRLNSYSIVYTKAETVQINHMKFQYVSTKKIQVQQLL